MKKQKIRIAMISSDLNVNGISAVIMNYCSLLNLEHFEITIFAGTPIDLKYLEECNIRGIKILQLPRRKGNPLGYYYKLWRMLSVKRYDIVHIHGNSATITIELLLAALKGIRIRIAHSHNSTCTHKMIHKLLSPIFNTLYTHGFACSMLAGKWMFGNNEFIVIPNGIDIEKFRFDSNIRNKTREQMKITDKFVIGHVGRFCEQKNQMFLLEVFKKIAEVRKDAVLLLIGTGEEFEKISVTIDTHEYRDRIILYGDSHEIEKLYCVMDVFVFPSKFEGLGIVLLEAQINGLHCVTSDVIPDEVILDPLRVDILSLNNSMDIWTTKILHFDSIVREKFYNANYNSFLRYDIRKNALMLEELYTSFYEKIHAS